MALIPTKPAPAASATAAPSKAKAKEESHPPQVDGFKIKGKLKGTIKDMTAALRSISFLEVAPEKDSLNVIYVESRDINRNPHLFSLVKFQKAEVEVVYSIPSGIAPKKRRVDVVLYLLNILSLVGKNFEIDNKALYQLVENAVKELASSVTMDYTSLYTSFDSLKKEVDDYRKKVERLTEQTEALTTQNYDLKTKNDELVLRVSELEALSDDALKTKLQEWVLEHNGSINISDFAKLFKVSDARVEEMLNKLMNEGYLEIVQ